MLNYTQATNWVRVLGRVGVPARLWAMGANAAVLVPHRSGPYVLAGDGYKQALTTAGQVVEYLRMVKALDAAADAILATVG